MVQPRLEVPWRGLDNERWLEAGAFHFRYCGEAEVVNQRKTMLTLRTAKDVTALAVLPPKPRNRPQQGIGVPNSGKHDGAVALSVRLKETNLECLATHRAYLMFDRMLSSVHWNAPYKKGSGVDFSEHSASNLEKISATPGRIP
jgi:hypothetical protein